MLTMKTLDGRGKGEYLYDYKNDIAFFKMKDRAYLKSVELDAVIVDIDTAGFITGIQIFDASKFFGFTKMTLRNIKKFDFSVNISKSIITINLKFSAIKRNEIIKQGNIISREFVHHLPASNVVCTV